MKTTHRTLVSFALSPRKNTLRKPSIVSVFALLVTSHAMFGQQTSTSPLKDGKEEESVALDKMVVEGSLLGQAKAIQGTKEAINVVNIISADKMGTFPDLNAAEALRRLPGVSLVLSGGEGRFVSIRGAAPNYNGTLVNGFSLPSGDAEIRRNDLVTVSNALIDTIVLTKTALPDMPADGIGGVTNILMRNPLDLKGREAGFSAFWGRNGNGGHTGSDHVRADVTYGDFLDKNHKYAFTATANYRLSDYDFTEYTVQFPVLQTATTGPQVYVPQQFRYQLTERSRNNKGLDIAFGAKIGDNTRIVLRGFKSDSYIDEYVHRYTWSQIFPYLSGGLPVEFGSTGGLVTARMVRLWRTRTWWLTIEGAQLTGETDLKNGFKLDYGIQRARSLERYRNDLFANGTNTSTTPDPIRVLFQSEAIKLFPGNANTQAIMFDPARQRIATVSVSPLRKDWETETTPYINLKRQFELGNQTTFELKSGLYFRLKGKANPNTSGSYTQLATGNLTFANLGNGGTFDDFDDKGINLGVRPNPDTGLQIVANNASSFSPIVYGILPGDVSMFNAHEDIYDGYVMGTYIKGPMTVIAGVRYEKTDEEFERLTTNTGGVYKKFEDNYDNMLPSIQVKYALSKDIFLRASWANTVGRPDAINLYGVETINTTAFTINQPNPGLEALESENIDLSLDWYSGPLGQFMVGGFIKNIDNFPLQLVDQIQLNGANYTRTRWQPSATGEIKGVEVSFRRNLDFLPGPFGGLGVDINYCGMSSEVSGTPGRSADKIPLPSQPKYVLNTSLYYAYKGVFLRLAMAEEGKLIRSVGPTSPFDEYRDVYQTYDFTANYEFGRRHSYQVFFEWRNINNEHDQSHYNLGPLTTRTGSGANVGGGVRVRF